jgi:hypothetical protein
LREIGGNWKSAIVVLTLAALLVASFKLFRPRSKASRWAVKVRPPVSPVEQQLYRRMIDAFPHCIVLS